MLTFSIDRCDARSLTSQLVDGLREAILTGVYAPGNCLPSLRQISEETGVSLIIVRRALERLQREGQVAPRPGSGNVVLGKGERRWKGHVLTVICGHGDNYVFNVMANILRERILQDGYLVSQVAAHDSKANVSGLAQFEHALSRTIDLVVCLGGRCNDVSRRLSKTGIPVVLFSSDGNLRLKNCVAKVNWLHQLGVGDFVAACRRRGVRRAIQVCCSLEFASAAPLLREAGIEVSVWSVNPRDELPGGIETVRTRCMELFEKRFARGRDWLPDVIYFSDDYLATEGIASLARHGVRIPEDVGVVTWRNIGLGPVFPKSLASLVMDPFAAGERIVGSVRAFLKDGRPVPDGGFEVPYREGESFV